MLVSGGDDGGSGCAITLLGLLRWCWCVRAVAGVGRQVRCCRGRRAALSGLQREVTINMLLGGHVARHGGEGEHGVHNGRCWNEVPLWQVTGWGGARRPPQPPSETMSLTPADAPWGHLCKD